MSAGIFATLAPLYWEASICVIPVVPGTKQPGINGWTGYSHAVPSEAKRRELLSSCAHYGIGLLTGCPIGNDERLGAVDVDNPAYMPLVRAMLGNPAVEKVGSKGGTFLVRYRDLSSTAIKDASKNLVLDILLSNKMTVLPPSIHPLTKEPYRWTGPGLLDVDLHTLPQLTREILDLLKRVIGSEHAATLIAGQATHEAGLALSAMLVRFGSTDEEIETVFQALLPADYAGDTLKELPGFIESAREKGFDQQPSGRTAGGKKESPVEAVIRMVTAAGVDLFHDTDESAYMTGRLNGKGTVTFRLGSEAAASALRHLAFKSLGLALREQQLNDIVLLLGSRARYEGPELPVFKRIARFGGAIYIDRGANDGSVVRITTDGVTLLAEPPVRFVRSLGMKELPIPAEEGDLDGIRELLSLHGDTFNLWLAFLLGCLRGDGPYFSLTIDGEQGSGKSFLSAVTSRIIDPNNAANIRLPDNERDLMVFAAEFFLLSFDNTSGMRPDISDLLCSLATGAVVVSRKLYTNGGVHLLQAKRAYIMNGIGEFATRSDLIERIIPIHLERPDLGARKTEAEMLEALNAMLPAILAALYRMVSCGLANEAENVADRGIRMIDAMKWLAATEPATGLAPGTFIETLQRCQDERMVERTNNDPIVIAIRELLQKGPFQGTIKELLEAIMPEFARPRRFPDTAVKLSKALGWLETGMKLAGIYFEREARNSKGNQIRVYLEGQENDEPQRKAPPSERRSIF